MHPWGTCHSLMNSPPSPRGSFLPFYLDYWQPGWRRARLAALAAWSRYSAQTHSSGCLDSFQQEASWTTPRNAFPSGPLCWSFSSYCVWGYPLGKMKAQIPGKKQNKTRRQEWGWWYLYFAGSLMPVPGLFKDSMTLGTSQGPQIP